MSMDIIEKGMFIFGLSALYASLLLTFLFIFKGGYYLLAVPLTVLLCIYSVLVIKEDFTEALMRRE